MAGTTTTVAALFAGPERRAAIAEKERDVRKAVCRLARLTSTAPHFRAQPRLVLLHLPLAVFTLAPSRVLSFSALAPSPDLHSVTYLLPFSTLGESVVRLHSNVSYARGDVCLIRFRL